MGKKIKILVVGLGSIGRRHLSHLIVRPDVEVAALRSSGTRTLEASHAEFFTIDDAIQFRPDGVIVCSPTSLHAQYALPFLKLGARVLIEKPLDHDTRNAQPLAAYSNLIRVAYCLRFLPVMDELLKIFRNDPPFKVSFKRSFYLPKWHPYADYRVEYAAKRDLGGGVIRTLSHELDLACAWFGKPVSIEGVNDKLSFLDIDTDDFAFYSLKMSSGLRVNFELDFFSPVNVNLGEAFSPTGMYRWAGSGITLTSYEDAVEKNIFASPAGSIDQMYNNQIADFIGFIQHGSSANATYADGLQVLDVIEHVEKR